MTAPVNSAGDLLLPSLNSVCELRRLAEKHGEPIACGLNADHFGPPCSRRPYSDFAPLIDRWAPSNSDGPRHWPALAYAVDQYDFYNREKQRTGSALSPAEAQELLKDVHKHAKGLARALVRLSENSNRLRDDAKPVASAHLAYLDQFIGQATAGLLASNIVEDPLVMFAVDAERKKLTLRLVDIEAASEVALKRLQAEMLKKPKPANDPGLQRLTEMASRIWQSLTGRVPSVNKVHGTGRENEVPDFVLFIQELVQLGNKPTLSIYGLDGGASRPAPTFNQVQTAFKKLPHRE